MIYDHELERKVIGSFANGNFLDTRFIAEAFSHSGWRKCAEYVLKNKTLHATKEFEKSMGLNEGELFSAMMNEIPDSFTFADALRRIKDYWIRRKELEDLKEREKIVRDLTKTYAEKSLIIKPSERFGIIDEAIRNQGKGLIFPWYSFYAVFGGLHAGDLYTIVAPSATYKTTLMLNMEYGLTKSNDDVTTINFSMEMKDNKFIERQAQIVLGLSKKEFLYKYHNEKEWLEQQLNTMMPNSYLVTEPLGIQAMCDVIQEVELESGKKVNAVFVDYLDFIKHHLKGVKGDYINLLARELKEFGKKNNVAVILLAQVDKDSGKRDENGNHKKIDTWNARGGSGIMDASDISFCMYRQGKDVIGYYHKVRDVADPDYLDKEYKMKYNGYRLEYIEPIQGF